ncbi:MAG: hypothetical protein U9Q81_12060 [Pseudomonadota bacterium]|nr:hypothetical protein [Pseudomonadota bacterium]
MSLMSKERSLVYRLHGRALRGDKEAINYMFCWLLELVSEKERKQRERVNAGKSGKAKGRENAITALAAEVLLENEHEWDDMLAEIDIAVKEKGIKIDQRTLGKVLENNRDWIQELARFFGE